MHIVALVLFGLLGLFLLFQLGSWFFIGDSSEDWIEHWERMRGHDEDWL